MFAQHISIDGCYTRDYFCNTKYRKLFAEKLLVARVRLTAVHLRCCCCLKKNQSTPRLVVFFTLTDRASTIPSSIRGCQSGTRSRRGTKVNGSHHGDNPLLRLTRIQIATKSYATLQAMAPTNKKTVHETSFTPYREQPRSTRIIVAYPRPAFSATNRTNTFQPDLINKSKFLKATHRTKIRKIEVPRSMVVEALSW